MAKPDPETQRIFEQFGDIFGELFGTGGAPRTGPVGPPSRDSTQSIRLSFAEAVDGNRRDVEVRRFFGCTSCGCGGGAEGARLKPCGDCGGAGSRLVRQGAFELRHTCAACQGRGGSWDRPCPDCDGAGGTVETETLAVTVPGGVEDGQVLRLKGKGNDPDGTGAGDLYLRLEVGPDPRLSRVGADLHARVKVDAEVAREGGKAKVPVPRGAVDVDVEPGTRSGDQRRLRGYGAVKLGSPSVPLPSGAEDPYRSVDPSEHRGDLVVTFEVEGQPLPEEQLSPEEREARDVERSDRRFLWASLVAGAVLAAAWLLSGAG